MLPCQLRYGRRQDKLGRGLGACFILYHDREFHPHHFCDIYAHRPSFLCVHGCGKSHLGALGVVLSWPRRKSDHERVREHRGGDSGWRRPRQLRNPNLFPISPSFFLPLSLSHVVTCLSHLASSHRPALCQGLVRNTMNTVLYHTRLGSKLTLETTLMPLDNVLSYNSRCAQTGIIHVLCFSFFIHRGIQCGTFVTITDRGKVINSH